MCSQSSFVYNDTATTEIYTYGHTLALHDALPIYLELAAAGSDALQRRGHIDRLHEAIVQHQAVEPLPQIVERTMIRLAHEGNVGDHDRDRKSTRLNSSH